MQLLRANTAVDVLIGPFVDDSDGKTAETGLTISQADVLLSKNGQALTQKNDATGASHDSSGYYNCELDATDTNTEGTLVIAVSESGALPVRHEFMVMAEAAWDSMFVAKDDGFMDVNIKTIGRADTQETEANNLESACSNYSATRGLSGTALPAAAADAAGGLPISDAGGLDMDAILADTNELQGDWVNGGRLDLLIDGIKTKTDSLTFTVAGDVDCNVQTWKGAAAQDMTGDAFARLGAPAGASVSADVAAIKTDTGNTVTDTNELQTDWTDGGRLDLLIDAIKAKTDNLPADPADDSDIDSQLATIDTNVDTLIARLTAARAGYLDELNVATSGKTSWYMKKMFIALVNQIIIEESGVNAGNTEQFDDAGASLGTITAAFNSDGTYTTRKRMVI